MLAGGIDVIQLRAKTHSIPTSTKLANSLHQLTFPANVPLIINDYPDIAAAVGAEGVHVGQDDRSIAEVKAIVGENCLVGKSTHSVDQAVAAEAEGADYIGFGPLFATPTKPDYKPIGLAQIAEVHEKVRIPIFCIGGIKAANLAGVISAGARRLVIVSELLQAPDIPAYVRSLKQQLA